MGLLPDALPVTTDELTCLNRTTADGWAPNAAANRFRNLICDDLSGTMSFTEPVVSPVGVAIARAWRIHLGHWAAANVQKRGDGCFEQSRYPDPRKSAVRLSAPDVAG